VQLEEREVEEVTLVKLRSLVPHTKGPGVKGLYAGFQSRWFRESYHYQFLHWLLSINPFSFWPACLARLRVKIVTSQLSKEHS
jgi:hypothetical protein